jgi:hypothetical protein
MVCAILKVGTKAAAEVDICCWSRWRPEPWLDELGKAELRHTSLMVSIRELRKYEAMIMSCKNHRLVKK